MTMWKVTIAPQESLIAWDFFVQQAVVGIGWPDHEWDRDPTVRQFRQIQNGDWVVAHVPKSHGGAPTLALGVGQIVGEYAEVYQADLPSDDPWSGAFRRQYPVEWILGDHPLREILNSWQFRRTVVQLSPTQERQILDLYEIPDNR
ncbi:MAG: hypothetical protein KBG20_01560 [Caldilineaceae bacterium]|nr:hypothetical protein [Caldilineaceae bacterium]MBP8107405.1 hypothetical protein [Caldilineaceae bacterium]MBP8124718.1 hypothetical protein [Caldilineaceae bacterium]MBP9070948.1 hypothetical protein [Caldilineaceae bacterium]